MSWSFLQQRQGVARLFRFENREAGRQRNRHRAFLQNRSVDIHRANQRLILDAQLERSARQDERKRRGFGRLWFVRSQLHQTVVLSQRQRDRSGGAGGWKRYFSSCISLLTVSGRH